MKNYQKLKTAFYSSLLLIVLLLSFNTSHAQYARLEKQDLVFYRVNTGNPDYPIHEYNGSDYYIRLYSDAACTIPITASADINISLNYTNYFDEGLNYGGDTNIYETLSNGQSEKYLAHIPLYDLYFDNYNTGWGLYTTMPGVSFPGSSITYVGMVEL